MQNNTSSIIDLVFVSNPSLVNECSSIPPLSISDHLSILLDLKKKLKPSDKCQGRLIWRYSHADWEKACDLIDSFEWDSILTDDIDASLKQWHEQLDIMAQSIPNRFLPPRRNLPWLTKPIIQFMRKRNMLFRKAKSSGNFTKYKRARNRTTNLLKLVKKRYFRSLNPKDSQKFWKAVKSLNKSKQSIPTLSHDGEVACDDADKANLLCSFFSSCFNQSCAPISPSPNHPLCFPFPDELLCTESEVFDLLATLDTANGQDGISARMLKSVAASITPSLTKLFNMSLMTGCIPTQWKNPWWFRFPRTLIRHPQPTIAQSHCYPLLVNFLSVMFIRSFYLTSKLIIHSPQSSGVFLRAVRPSLPFSIALTNGSKLLRMEKKCVQYFLISRKRSTQCLILRSWQNYTLLDLMNTYYAGSTTIFQIVLNQLLLMALSLLLPKSSPEFLKDLSLGLCSFSSTLTTFLVFFITWVLKLTYLLTMSSSIMSSQKKKTLPWCRRQFLCWTIGLLTIT